tara:strand:- start:34889 stop:35620 length:732 start_codon:yes stop_codon:yes gene_type:complete
MSRTLGVIVARGNSKRIPRKVVRPLLGAPLISWVGNAAKASHLDRVIVSTEDTKIAEEATKWGMDVPFIRPEELAGDFICPEDVLIHALQVIEAQGVKYDNVALIQPTAPFITGDSINLCLEEMKETNTACCFLARQVSELPQWMFKENSEGYVELIIEGELSGSRQHTQLVEPAYIPAGAVWVVRKDILLTKKKIYVSPMKKIILPREYAVDIDEEYDFVIAEAIAHHYHFIPPKIIEDKPR